MISASSDFINALTSQAPKVVYVKMDLYDSNMTFIETITTYVTTNDIANISVDRERPIRRSFSFALDNSDGRFTWGTDKTIWIDKRVKMFIGVKLADGTIEYVPQGVFIISTPYDTNNLDDGKKCYIEGVDKAYLLTDKRGKIENPLIISTGTNIATAIKTVASDGGETMFNFDAISNTTPYELSYDAGTNRWEIMSELAEFGLCDLAYDVNGYLRLRYLGDLNNFYNFAETWTYEYGGQNGHMYAGNIRQMDESKLCNAIRVMGGSGSTAVVLYDLIVDETDPLWTNSPYSIQKLGHIWYGHNDWNPDPLISTEALAKARAKYELMRRLGYSELVTLSISWNILHEPIDVIRIVDSESGIDDRYMITSLNIPLIPEAMTIECFKEVVVIDDWDFI